MINAHHSTVQLSSIVLKLRDDLTVEMREYGGQPVYIFEDELNSRFYRVGLAEYTFLSMLDGRTTFADALGRTASVMKQDALNEQEAASLCRWVVESQLASTDASQSNHRLLEVAEQANWTARKSMLNPLYQKLPIFNPNALMGSLNSAFGWVFSQPFFIVWLWVFGAGCWCIVTQWSEFTASQPYVISRTNWIWLVLTWVVLRLVHESAHGIACRRFGGTVREAGVMLILFAPLPYVDVTSIWRLDSRFKRMLVSAAGMYVELFIMGIAALIWSSTDSTMMKQQMMNIIVSSGLTTIIFNANPLMRFDGYHILADWLELPNLATHGQQSMQQFGREYILGMNASPVDWPEGRRLLIGIYGVLAFAWRILIAFGIILSADAMFYGAGIVLAAIGLVFCLVLPALKLGAFLLKGTETEQPDRIHFAMVAGSAAALIGGLLTFAPWYARVQAPAVVDFYPLTEIRTPAGGFVEQIHVMDGQAVKAGQLLLSLSNPDLRNSRAEVEAQWQQSLQRARAFRNAEEIAAWQAEIENSNSLQLRKDQLDQQLASLSVTAPIDGVVIRANLESLQHDFVQAGEAILAIGNRDDLQLIAMINQHDVSEFREQEGQPVKVHVWGVSSSTEAGRLTRVNPRAQTKILHPAFSASAGGELEVVAHKASLEQEQSLELLEPHFMALVEIHPDQIEQIRAGQTGFVGFRTQQGNLGSVLTQKVTGWWSDRQQRLRSLW